MLSVGAPVQAQDDVPEVVRRLLDEGRRHLQEGRVDRAVAILTEALHLDASTVRVYLDLGAAQVRAGDVPAAIATFERGLEIAPAERDLLYNAAVLRLRQGDADIALGHVETALRGEVSVDLLQLQAGCLARLERHEDALAALRRAEKDAPRSARLQFSIGNQLHHLGRLDAAAAAFEKALRLDSSLIRASYNLGAVLVELGRYEEAGKAYEDALAPLEKALRRGESVEPIHAAAFANLGAAYTQSRRWDDAAEAYDAATRIDPQNADAFLNLGFALVQKKAWQEAAAAYERTVELDPSLSSAYLQLGEIAHARGRCEAAVDWLQRGLAVLDGAGRLDAMERMARCYTELGRPDDAEQVFRKVLAESPSDPALLADFGAVLRRNGRLEEAWQTLSRSLELRDDLQTRLEALAVAEATDRPADRERLLRSVDVDQDPARLWPVRREVAWLDLRAGRWQDAANALASVAAVATVPENERPFLASWASIASWLAGTSSRDAVVGEAPGLTLVRHAAAGRGQEASKLAATLPGTGPVLMARALLEWQLGQDATAAGLLAAARRQGFDGSTAGHVVEAETRLQAGDAAGAVAGFERAAELCDAGDQAIEKEIMPADPRGSHGVFVAVTRPAGAALCAFARARLPVARLQAAVLVLRRAPSTAREAARSLAASADAAPELRAAARFVEGTALLVQGSPRDSVAMLKEAVEAPLPAAWQDAAWVNLGVAQSVLGDVDGALRSFAAAASPDAVLNAAILRQDRLNDPQGALELYERYLSLGGARSHQVESWAQHLREIYR